ncbi:hypothetical protein BASA50_003618 [Batrachochytrium salamandrivorans]|uniref:N-acetyltransferase domain-containing protein n=1 Tax=Batrachochytrium salamandrivorans TaxID=1357716 RepID=A0ABQ8FI62_9FUNG|nr:hypothetical protein BASA62_007278 [Batrachochytrium salamandrivorans]KAH6569876.1 hypothetical protein BASA60_008072 [Batrachochytrium salamandrivorans]KAH6598580.1 hypothetical protein BASA50_003618 [Batrachochytrium salamandrivorans]KAH6600757.1 hypothetical protein BASA61_002174 [Batrachochytrium salamandrivorans]KAH9266554.1 hypothetical protein BASA84_001040 [Batrachochytrium salamandrivorans]
MAIILRPAIAGPDDDAAVNLAVINWRLTPTLMPADRVQPEPLLATRRARHEKARNNPGTWLFLVAVDEESGVIVGHVDGGPAQAHDDELVALGVDLDNTIELLTLHVHPDYSRKGIGGTLTDAFFDWLPSGMHARQKCKQQQALAETVSPLVPSESPTTCLVIVWTWLYNTKSKPFYLNRGAEVFMKSTLHYLGTDVPVICFKWTVSI